MKRLFTALCSILFALTVSIAVLEYAPGTRHDYDKVKSMERGVTTADPAQAKPQVLNLLYTRLRDFSHGDFGESLTFNQDVKRVLFNFTKISIIYWFFSFAFTLLLGVALSYVASGIESSPLYSVIKTISLFLYKIPTFLVGLFLLYLGNRFFSQAFFRMEEAPRDNLISWSGLTHLWLPTLTYLAFMVPSLFLQVDTWIQEEQQKEYLSALKARGFSTYSIFLRHILPNLLHLFLAILPILLRNILILSVAVEITFQIHGFGYLSFISFTTRDTPMLVFLFLTAGLSELTFKIVCDFTVSKLIRKRSGLAYA